MSFLRLVASAATTTAAAVVVFVLGSAAALEVTTPSEGLVVVAGRYAVYPIRPSLYEIARSSRTSLHTTSLYVCM